MVLIAALLPTESVKEFSTPAPAPILEAAASERLTITGIPSFKPDLSAADFCNFKISLTETSCGNFSLSSFARSFNSS